MRVGTENTVAVGTRMQQNLFNEKIRGFSDILPRSFQETGRFSFGLFIARRNVQQGNQPGGRQRLRSDISDP
jgi:hypothetical protein